MKHLRSLLFFSLPILLNSGGAYGAPLPHQGSYIEELKSQMREQGQPTDERLDASSPQNYIDAVKKHDLPPVPEESTSYIEQLRMLNAADEKKEPEGTPSYLEREKAKLEPQPEGGAIDALLTGNSELTAKKRGNIHYAFGLRYGVSISRLISAPAGTQRQAFNDIYGSQYAPDLSLFYEFQPFHSEWFGNFGIVAMAGLGYFRGFGQYSFDVPKPGNAGNFDPKSSTKFQFFAIPLTVALDYRFNLFRVLRPYILVGPTLVGYFETRDDSVRGNRGNSRSLLVSTGVSILLDWMDTSASWDLYTIHGIHHYYLTVDYSRLFPIGGDVDYGMSGVTLGFTFEY